jgi:hypothetical protein
MSQDTSSNARRLLPQSSQMNSFSFAPPTTYQQPPREQQKSAQRPLPRELDRSTSGNANHYLPDYVFVDEHNRHKRLKGMWASVSRTIGALLYVC